MSIELSNDQDSDHESVDSICIKWISQSKELSKRLINSLFGEKGQISEVENEWMLPKI